LTGEEAGEEARAFTDEEGEEEGGCAAGAGLA
jgi:hypothetical protein